MSTSERSTDPSIAACSAILAAFSLRFFSSSSLARRAASMASFTASPSPPASRFPMTFIDPSFINLSAASAWSPPPVLPPPGPPPSSEMKNLARACSFALRTSSSFFA